MRWAGTTTLLGLALLAVGCGETPPPGVACPAIAAAGLDVAVVDDRNGQPLCDATVTAREGSYSEQLTALSCRYVGAIERPGTYLLSAERSGYRAATRAGVSVVMGGGTCPHVVQTTVELRLSPLP